MVRYLRIELNTPPNVRLYHEVGQGCSSGRAHYAILITQYYFQMKTIINTKKAPAPIGPYSQAVQAGNMLFISGQIAIDPSTEQVINGTVEDEAKRVMQNIEELLSAANYTFENVIKTSIFLSDMKHFAAVNEIYGSYFNSEFPARETVAVLGLPKNVNVEISVTAYKA